jgi:hypothetical protein
VRASPAGFAALSPLELISIAAFLTVTVGCLADAAGHLPL